MDTSIATTNARYTQQLAHVEWCKLATKKTHSLHVSLEKNLATRVLYAVSSDCIGVRNNQQKARSQYVPQQHLAIRTL